jgi:hypothetical protein
MNDSPRSHWRRRAGWAILFTLVLLTGAYIGPGVWRECFTYWAMSRECHPVWNDLYWGRIRAGDDVEEVIARTQPPVVERFDNFVALSYVDRKAGLAFTGLQVFAKDGKLVSAGAWSCTWHRTFFDELSEADRQAGTAAYQAHLNRQRKAREGGG